MAKRREQGENLEQTKRISPYQQIDEEYENAEQEVYEDEYADEYDGEYEDEEYEEDAQQTGGFFSTPLGKIAVIAIAVLFVLLLVLLGVRFFSKPEEAQQLPESTIGVIPAAQETAEPTAEPIILLTAAPQEAEETSAPATIVFAPVSEATAEPTAVPTAEPTVIPTATPTVEPTDEPEATATPLPIILTNTPTPSPSPTPTATPSPSPVPTSTPEPTPTPKPEIGTGEVNRDANLRESASSSAKVKQTVKKGETVTIHESVTDKSNKVWYSLTVDDQAVSGYMRDYVVDLKTKLAEVTEETEEPEETAETAAASEDATETTAEETETEEPTEEAIAVGEANRDANIRKSMNGSVLATVKEGKSVTIYEVLKDKSGNVWYRLSVDESGTAGYMRDYVIDLEDDTELEVVTDVEKASVGTAKTNRDANVRKSPKSNGTVVRQISEGVKVYIMGKYKDSYDQIWYQISTESGNTTGFMRDYVLSSVKLDDGVETQTYE